MESSIKDLSRYRFMRAKEDLETSELLLTNGKYKQSINRSYYAVFHGMRAVTALVQFDASRE